MEVMILKSQHLSIKFYWNTVLSGYSRAVGGCFVLPWHTAAFVLGIPSIFLEKVCLSLVAAVHTAIDPGDLLISACVTLSHSFEEKL